ncbi:alpha/beta hydrolase [Roseomonas sp. HJA6]|uniref:Alpha/beta hydrolase n=1 Tax=Roseomonas alba TaxID=2846776 RepID=A0ABS7A3T0_9PROT|nr:alpha/beta hydrolase [Neoroseomonas alba]MBW6396957.1 alpha/beta hydrolase [Neoroseomonas alba]
MTAQAGTPTILDTARGPIEAVVSGEGPALLAIHGGMGGHDQSGLLARALLADASGHRVVAVSRPGYLGSPLPVGESAEDQADALAALLDRLGIASAAVAAVSAGGPSALHFAIRHPERCRALILVSACTGRLETPPAILSRLRMMARLARLPLLPPLLRWRTRRNPAAAAARAIPDPGLRARTMADPTAGPLFRALQAGVFDHLADRLPGTINDITRFGTLAPIPFDRVAAPTLVIHGRADDIVPPSHGDAAARGIPGAEHLAIDGAGHVALFTHLAPIREKAARLLAAAPT